MRTAQALCMTVTLVTGNGCFLVPEANHNDERAVCETYLDCVTVTTPEAGGGAVVLYGEDSACWASSTDAERCAVACEEALGDLAEAFPLEAECLPEGETVPDLSLTDEAMDWMLYLDEIDEADCNLSQVGFPDEILANTEPTGAASFDLRLEGWSLQDNLSCNTDGQRFTCNLGDDADLVGTVDPSVSEMTLDWPVYMLDVYCGRLVFSGERQ